LYSDLNDSSRQRLLIDIERKSGKLDGKKKQIEINVGKNESDDDQGGDDEDVEVPAAATQKGAGRRAAGSSSTTTTAITATRSSARRSGGGAAAVSADVESRPSRHDRKGKQRA
jgi:hypothetical protein